MRTHLFPSALAGALLLGGADAAAEPCNFLPTPRQILVGETASDSACNFADIGAAIADAALHPTCTTTIHIMRSYNYEHLSISGQSLNLQGWGDGVSCSSLAAQCDPLAGCPAPDHVAANAYADVRPIMETADEIAY